jgi:Fe-S cluster assembly protein SufD
METIPGTPTGVAWLDQRRAAAWHTYQETPPPDRANHLWRYSDPQDFLPPAGAARTGEVTIERIDALRAAGVEVLPLAEAAERGIAGVAERLGSLVGEGFGKIEAWNAAAWSCGFFVRVPRGVRVEEPIRIATNLGPEEGTTGVRNLVLLEEDAAATIVEESRGPETPGRRRLIEVTEVFVGAGGEARMIPLQHVGREVVTHRTLRVRLEQHARAKTVMASLGAALYKADVGVLLCGSGAESRMGGVCFADGRQRADHHTVHDHRADHTSSNIDFRVVLGGRARSAYTGLIRIVPEAPYSEAYQENRNLLLSDQSRAESIPELEILTDEVRCKHGATVGPVDAEALFYLGTRGLSKTEATRLVISGFLEQALIEVPENLAEPIRAELTGRLMEATRR